MLPTQKLYQPVDRSQYEAIKTNELHLTLPPYYFESEHSAKWLFLESKFLSFWPESQADIVSFFRRRLATEPSSTNISLADCINYFEQFYFLNTTEHPSFKLDDREKRELRVDLLEAMLSTHNPCETGLQQRFEDNLSQYRRDTNWIAFSLSRMRDEILMGLAQQCNTELNISDALRVHTNKFMRELAFNKELGIETDTNLTDAYLHVVNSRGITRYFKSHYAAAFHVYENSAADHLSEKLLDEFTEFLDLKVGVATWEQECIVLDVNYLEDLNRFFADKSFNSITDDLLADDADATLKLKTKADFKRGLRSLVNKKLIEQGYYLGMENLHELTSTALSDLPALPIWHGGPSIQDYAALNRARETSMPAFYAALKQHALSLLKDPRFVLACVDESPEILGLLPDEYPANAHFIDKALAVVSTKVSTAIRDGDEQQISLLFGYLYAFLPRTFRDFSSLPPHVLNNDIVRSVIKETEIGIEDAKTALSISPQLSPLEVELLTKDLSISDLQSISQTRETEGLSPLPYCNNRLLLPFVLALNHEGIDLAREYWSVKRQAEDVYAEANTIPHELSPLRHLALNHSWYMTLVEYHHANQPKQPSFQTWASFFNLLQDIILGIVEATLWSLTFVGFVFGLYCSVMIPLLTLEFTLLLTPPAVYGPGVIVVCILLPLSAIVLNLGLIIRFSDTIKASMDYFRYQADLHFNLLFNNAYALIAGIYATLFPPAESVVMASLAESVVMASLVDRCERSITRLRFDTSDVSANEKGLLLNTLWDKIKNEPKWDSSDEVLNGLLNKKYEVSYEGSTHLLSFSQVASIKRRDANRFNLTEPQSVYGFFTQNRATTTDSILDQPAKLTAPAH